MGVHFANPALLEDDVLDKAHPEALIYEFKNDVARLVGVEFIVIADVWHMSTTRRKIRPSSRASYFSSSTVPIASDYRHSTSSTCGRGGTTPTAHLSIGTPVSPVKGSEGHVINC